MPDPRFVTISTVLAQRGELLQSEKVHEVELEVINRREERHQHFFKPGTLAVAMAERLGDNTNLLTLRSPEDVTLVDNMSSVTSVYLALQVKACNNSTSPTVCAAFGDKDEHL